MFAIWNLGMEEAVTLVDEWSFITMSYKDYYCSKSASTVVEMTCLWFLLLDILFVFQPALFPWLQSVKAIESALVLACLSLLFLEHTLLACSMVEEAKSLSTLLSCHTHSYHSRTLVISNIMASESIWLVQFYPCILIVWVVVSGVEHWVCVIRFAKVKTQDYSSVDNT